MATEEKQQDIENEELGGLDGDDDQSLTLVSMEESSPQKFTINKKAAEMCKLVRSILEGDQSATEIPIKK